MRASVSSAVSASPSVASRSVNIVLDVALKHLQAAAHLANRLGTQMKSMVPVILAVVVVLAVVSVVVRLPLRHAMLAWWRCRRRRVIDAFLERQRYWRLSARLEKLLLEPLMIP